MQTVDAASFEADADDILCMLCFTDDGTARWSTGLGQVSTGFVQRIIHVFRASCSISQAFAKGFGESPLNENSLRQTQQSGQENEDAVLVKCEKDMVILAKRVYRDSSLWFALVGKPFTLDYGQHCLRMLHTLEQLAVVLFGGVEDDNHNRLHDLCDSICKLLRSTSPWFGNDKGRVAHFMGSLFAFCNAQKAKDGDICAAAGQHDQSSTATARRTLLRSIESWQLDISQYFGSSHSRLLIFSHDLKPLHAQNISPNEKHLLMWYYSTCLTSHLGGFKNFFSEQDDHGVLRVWYRRRGLILFTNFVMEKTSTGNPMRKLQRSADTLVDALLHVIT